jgi:molybdopterin/thiamine biosynthesis adenylyltransferase/rhodanese-related sulfurtransferase/molybdopterin converting factor small subunit
MLERLTDYVIIRIPLLLRSHTGGAEQLLVQAVNVAQALSMLEESAPGVRDRVLTAEGELHPLVNIYLGADDIRLLDGLLTPLNAGAVLSIVPTESYSAANRERRLARLREQIPEIEPAEALGRQTAGAVLIDVRDGDEVSRGSPLGAVRLNRGFLELRIEAVIPDYEQPIIILCSNGIGSLFAADSLLRMGYRRVASVLGGFSRWQADGLAYEFPPVMNGEERRGSKRPEQEAERYSRQREIPEIGVRGQEKLLASKVLLVGLGGLGCPAALYLAAAGVGRLGVVDDGLVARRNLQREVLHTDRRSGQLKVDSARSSLLALNPGIHIDTYPERLAASNVERICTAYDLVVDCAGDSSVAGLLNETCLKLGIPHLHGVVESFAGYLTVLWPAYAGRRGPCYRCLHPETPSPPRATAAPGVMGFVPGMIGLLGAVEAIKLLLGLGDPLVGRLLRYEALAGSFVERTVLPDPACPCCGEARPA